MDPRVVQLLLQAESLADQFNQGGRTTRRYIDVAIALDRGALELCPPGHHTRSLSLSQLSFHLSTRYAQCGEIADVEEAIVLEREALVLHPQGHPYRSTTLCNLAKRLSTRYSRFGTMPNLDEAVILTQEALALCQRGHPCRSNSLTSLGSHLYARYNVLGAISDLNEAIILCREALELCPQGHSHRSAYLDNLGIYLSTRYDKLGAVVDLDEAIVLAREAVTLRPEGHPDRSNPLNNLANSLLFRYHRSGSVTDLDEAISLSKEALALRPDGHPLRSSSLNNLAVRLSIRYDRLGAVSDLDEAIVLDQAALALRPKGHPGRSMSLSNLAIRFTTRYNKFGAISDLNEAIALDREGLALRQKGHPDRSMSLNNLAVGLSARYNKLGQVADLDEIIPLAREALTLRPEGHPERAMSLNNLSVLLSSRYNKFGVVTDLDEAITLDREALSLRPEGNPLRYMSLNNLAIRFSSRYEKLGSLADLDKAIALCREALKLCSQGHPGHWLSLKNLARWLSSRHDNLNAERSVDTSVPSSDLDEAFCVYSLIADLSYTVSSGDLEASRAWILAAEKFKHSSTCLAYETSLRLLVELLCLLPSLPQHFVILKEHTSSVAIDAFSACLRNGAPKRAVELLEQGRSVFWNQLTRLRSPLDDVFASGPGGAELANKFTDLTSLVRKALHSPDEDQLNNLFHLNLEMQSVVTAIRELPGLSRFLLPSLFEDLQHAAIKGPVIIVNASQYGCDVLIVLDNHDPVHIPLSITRQHVRLLSSKLRGLPKCGNERDVTNILGKILRELWEDIVSPVVDSLETIHPLGSRIWWCPTAEFSDLPLHAAGPFRRGLQNLSDLYISSYTPTLSALIRARQTPVSKAASDVKRFLAIGQANAVGQNELLSVSSELASLGKDVGGAAAFKRIDGAESRIPLVAEELGKNEWVHFACHGLANRREPFKSAFALRDGHFTIEQIIRCDLGDPEFTYLSACQTTVGDEESPDESIHLASAMQFLGFRSVIGTMWSVADKDTNVITSTFYSYMFDESGRLDHTRAAFALNETMKTISGVTLDQRVVYIHLGA